MTRKEEIKKEAVFRYPEMTSRYIALFTPSWTLNAMYEVWIIMYSVFTTTIPMKIANKHCKNLLAVKWKSAIDVMLNWI